MNNERHIDFLSITGFKSIQHLDRLKLNKLNVLIGANGVGKSNFISYFRMLSEMMALRLQHWTTKQGGADRILSFGVKETNKLESFIKFGRNAYQFELEPTVNSGFSFCNEQIFFDGDTVGPDFPQKLGSGHTESKLQEHAKLNNMPGFGYRAIANWRVFHFHDTSDTAGVKRIGALQDNQYLRPDASNLAAYLYKLSRQKPDIYNEIRAMVSLAIPFFDDFILEPKQLDSGEEQIALVWKQKDSDYPLWPSQLSDGSIRFICLVTALLLPDPPATLIIDEPELGLHPYAINLLGGLLRSASTRMQLIVSTQSIALVNEFSIDDLIIVERKNSNTVFKRYEEQAFQIWLEDYSVGELWAKNILGGRPHT